MDELTKQVATICGYGSEYTPPAFLFMGAEQDYKVATWMYRKTYRATDDYTKKCKAIVTLIREHLLEALCSSTPYVREMAQLITKEGK